MLFTCLELSVIIVAIVIHIVCCILLQSSKYYKGGFEPKMTRREASLVLGVRCIISLFKLKYFKEFFLFSLVRVIYI